MSAMRTCAPSCGASRRSTNADRITQPLLVVHGKNDPRVPVSEAEQIVNRLRAKGGEVWYLLAADEGHGYRKKQNRDAYYRNVRAVPDDAAPVAGRLTCCRWSRSPAAMAWSAK